MRSAREDFETPNYALDLVAKLSAAQDQIRELTHQLESARDLAVRSGIFESEDWAQPEPDDDVIAVNDYTAPDNEQDGYVWGRTHRSGEYGPHSEWKGYKNGGKVYLDWPELVRRWGPLTVAARSGGES